MNDVIGMIAEVTTPTEVEFVASRDHIPQVGDYVMLEFDGNRSILGMITHVERGSIELSDRSLRFAEEVEKIVRMIGGKPSNWARATVKLLGMVTNTENGVELMMPRSPPPTGGAVGRAPSDVLRRIFSDAGQVKLGHLLTREDVEVRIDINEVVSRHLAVLAVTGAGKSNSIAVIIKEVVERGGPVVLFDMHSEYAGIDLGNGCPVVEIDPFLDVNKLSLKELARLLGISYEKAAKQYIYLRRAWNLINQAYDRDRINELIKEAGGSPKGSADFLECLELVVKKMIEATKQDKPRVQLIDNDIEIEKKDRNSIYSLLARIENLKENYGNIIKPNEGEIADRIRGGTLVVVKLGSVDTDISDVIVGHALSTILSRAKRRIIHGKHHIPVLTVLEEAHILIPNDRTTYTREAASRIAREGRKFGVGLILVSQRPKKLDQDVLSQMVNKIILRIVEPEDQSYVVRATEFMSEEMLEYLPSLNVGEAILVGPMVKIPAIVKFDKFEGKRGGASIRATDVWKISSEDSENQYWEMIR
ncbi:MAG: ATPase [Thermoproteota archaeon]|jgi:DNA helicase HerA-like ATPase|uniref:ATP-binding protein n=1 Tax=Candidatus Methanodesulfokora washburnensis TaxID=2478471 RepID=A0A429GQG1_9CREN|nr:ATP-binding protein [Candidatus Methanodesulfokores washburnensis]RSN75953.1 ATP-binding protein [Candidatus Methanodesulfokores washburnensis]RZN62630.1 MAG: ATP-binding protein [Candidatus Methanodesulfokores washburnensis]TDA42023.1 MAG: ATPase [Candidatus Korarchaeota archaeon]